MKWISRSILMLMIALGALLLALGPRPHYKVPAGRTAVQYWEKWSGRDAEPMRAVVEDFNTTVGKEKGIFIEYTSMATVQYKTLAATAAGTPPDLAGLWPDQVVQYSIRNAAMQLDDLAREYRISPDDYKKVFWDMCVYKGKLFALPTTPAVIALHYNKKFFYQAQDKLYAMGLDPSRAPRTIEEFNKYAEALDVYIPGTTRLSRAGYFTMDSGWYIAVQNIWFGGHSWDEASETYNMLDPANVAAFEWIAGFSRRMGAQNFVDFQSGLGAYSSPTNPFLSGSVAMVQMGQWMANLIERFMPDMSQEIVPYALEPFLPRVVRPFNYEWAAEAFPSAVPGAKDVSYDVTDVLIIPRGSKHACEAFEFMAFVQRQEEMEKLCKMSGKNSPLKKNSEDWVYANPNPYVDVYDRLAASPNARPNDQTPVYNEALTLIQVAAEQTYLLKKTPVEALTEAQREISKRLASEKQLMAARAAWDGK